MNPRVLAVAALAALLAPMTAAALPAPAQLLAPEEFAPPAELDAAETPTYEVESLEPFVVPGPKGTYTLNGDFDQGAYVNVGHPIPDQLQLTNRTAFNFMWIAVSSKGTAVLIDTKTGAVLGEYWTSPNGTQRDPSRTTVDRNGNVWLTNRAEAGFVGAAQKGSVLHIANKALNQCVDRNGNGQIDTSTGLNNIRGWDNVGGVNTAGGVSTAKDECILHYVRTQSLNNRHVSVTKTNDVWVSGIGRRDFSLINGATGAIMRVEVNSLGCGGYGGLIDNNGVIWSTTSGSLLRWDTAFPLNINGRCLAAGSAYGLCRDSIGNVWSSTYTSTLQKWSPAGLLVGNFNNPAGIGLTQGCVVDKRDHVWVSNGFDTSTVSHFLPSGVFVGAIGVLCATTGVAVDGDGFIWATGYGCQRGLRINPNAGPIGGGGAQVGAADIMTTTLGGVLYNYSDMTGSLIPGLNDYGTWIAIHDSGLPIARWGKVSWTGSVPAGASLTVSVASSADRINFSPYLRIGSGACFAVPDGRYLRTLVEFRLSPSGQTPILYDLSLQVKPVNIAEARAFAAGTTVPATVGYATVGRAVQENGAQSGHVVGISAPLPAAATLLDESARATNDCVSATARAATSVAEANLAGGAIVARGLVHQADAAYSVNTLSGTLGVTRIIERLVIQGNEVPVIPDQPQVIEVPGVGRLSLFEESRTQSGIGVEYRGALLRLTLAPTDPLLPGGEEVVVGAVRAFAGLVPPTAATPQNDAHSGRDAGATTATAVRVPAPGAFDGALPAGDTADWYAFDVSAPLTHVVATLAVAHRATAVGGGLEVDAAGPSADPTAPALAVSALPDATVDSYSLVLRNAAGTIVFSATTGAGAPPSAVEATVAAGTWYLAVTRNTAGSVATPNYLVGIGVLPA